MTQLLDLPAELLDEIAQQLEYPDGLALKISCRYFYRTIHLTIMDRVTWLVKRGEDDLPIPCTNHLDLKTDAGFCSNPEIHSYLCRRRKHLECRPCRRYQTHLRLVNRVIRCPKLPSSTNQYADNILSMGAFSRLIAAQGNVLLHGNGYLLLILLLSIVLQIP